MNESIAQWGFELGEYKIEGEWWQVVPVIVLFIASVVWIEYDARSRGKSGCLALIFLVAATWPLSILWWLWLRPPLQTRTAPPSKPPPLS